MLYQLCCPWPDSSEIDVVAIRDGPEEDMNGKARLLNCAEMRDPAELVPSSR